MTIFTKICGITKFSDAKCAIENGAQALGFVAFPPSPRNITPEKFAEIAKDCKKLNKETELVVVMVNPTKEQICCYLEAGADIVQLHGQETPDFVNSLTCRCWKAFNIKDQQQLNYLKAYNVERFLIDSFVKGAKIPGGTGHVADWDLSKLAVDTLPAPVILAGGISADNILEAWQTVEPYGFDVSSSVEESPGIKSSTKIEELCNKVKEIEKG